MSEGLIHVTIVTVDGEDRVYEKGGIIWEDGVITHVGDEETIKKAAEEKGTDLKDGNGMYLFPGLVNTHTHLYQDLMKGMGSDLSLEDWFPKSMAPAGAALKARHVEAGVKLGLVEAVRCGVTTVQTTCSFSRLRVWESWSCPLPGKWECAWYTAEATGTLGKKS